MSEIARLREAWLAEQAAGRPAALATLVRTRGSSYRRAGARALVFQDGRLLGGISGGCLEHDVALRAREVLETGKPSLAAYDTGADDDRLFGLNIGCGGLLDVLVEPLEPAAAERLALLEKVERERRRAVLATLLAPPERLGEWLLVGNDGEIQGGNIAAKLREAALEAAREALARPAGSPWRLLEEPAAEVFLEPIAPPQALLLFGSGFDVEPLAAFGRALGFEVVVVDARGGEEACGASPPPTAGSPRPARPPLEKLGGLVDASAAALVMNHHFDADRDLVRALLGTAVGYLGLLGPQSRGRRLLAELKDEDPALDTGRVFSRSASTSAPTPPKRWRCRSSPRSWRSSPAARADSSRTGSRRSIRSQNLRAQHGLRPGAGIAGFEAVGEDQAGGAGVALAVGAVLLDVGQLDAVDAEAGAVVAAVGSVADVELDRPTGEGAGAQAGGAEGRGAPAGRAGAGPAAFAAGAAGAVDAAVRHVVGPAAVGRHQVRACWRRAR